jgi:hypothetical protein
MSFLLVGLGVVFCIGLALAGYFWPLVIGGFIGSFFGVAGFGGAISGAIPGAIVGALIAIAWRKSSKSRHPDSRVTFPLLDNPPDTPH